MEKLQNTWNSARTLYGAFTALWCFCGFRAAQQQHNSIRTSDLDRSRLTDTRSTENDRIGADTDPEYQIDASLLIKLEETWTEEQ